MYDIRSDLFGQIKNLNLNYKKILDILLLIK